MDSLESELETTKDRLRKNVEAVEGINKTILVFENRHIETVERMREVSVVILSLSLIPVRGDCVGLFSGDLREERGAAAGAGQGSPAGPGNCQH